jgi:hypothetical protein
MEMFKRLLKVAFIIVFMLIVRSGEALSANITAWMQLLLFDFETINVDPDLPNEYATIQEAIDAANDGDQIIVAPGTYQENIDFKGKGITVKSAQGPEDTVIDGGGAGSVVTFSSGEGRESVIEGFSIINGAGTANPDANINVGGGGILCVSSSPTIKNNHIYDCSADYGAGILSTDVNNETSSPLIIGNTIYNNIGVRGAGIFTNYSSAEITNNTIRENEAAGGGGGIMCWHESSPNIVNNVIHDNEAGDIGGGGIRVYNLCNADITNNTVYGNTTSGSGGALYVRHSSPEVINSIFWGNEASVSGDEIWVGPDAPDQLSELDISYSDVQGGLAMVEIVAGNTVNWGGGMINANPLFTDAGSGDFRLQSGSPCIGAGEDGVDMGYLY